MVESLKELNQICQKQNYKTVGNWMVRHILRDAALPVTWLLLHTAVTANQVTVISLIVGMAGIALFSFVSAKIFLLGAVLLQLWYFLDHVDGQIARYRKTADLSGRFHDFMTHHLIHGCILFSFGVYGYAVTDWFFMVLMGAIGSLGIILFNLINDTKCKTFMERLYAEEAVTIRQEIKAAPTSKEREGKDWRKQVFSFLHKSVEIHVLMNVIAVAALLEYFVLTHVPFRILLLLYYGLLAPALAGIKITYLISHRKIDSEYEQAFRPVR